MKKYFTAIMFLLLMKLPARAGGFAGDIQSPLTGSIEEVFSSLTGLIRPVVLITFLGVMIFGGYTRMTAAGNAEKEEKAVKIITGGIVGFILVALAPVIVSIVGQLINLPTLF